MPPRRIDMKKIICTILLLAITLSLCSCSAPKTSDIKDRSFDYDVEAHSYWRVEKESLYPFGVTGYINGMVATQDYIYVSGEQNNTIFLKRIEYKYENDHYTYNNVQNIELPNMNDASKAVGLCYTNDKLFFLLSMESELDLNPSSGILIIINENGEMARIIKLSYPEAETPKSFFVTTDETIVLLSEHFAAFYSANGESFSSIKFTGDTVGIPFARKDNIFAWYRENDTGNIRLVELDTKSKKILPLLNEIDIPISVSNIQSATGETIINDGEHLLIIDENFNFESCLDWYAVFSNYGNSYKDIYKLDNHSYIINTGNAGELLCFSVDYIEDKRETINIGFFGQTSEFADQLGSIYTNCNPDYKVQTFSYSADETGRTKLLADLSNKCILDLVVSEGFYFEPTAVFADLNPFIDSDEELRRDSFLPFILNGLQNNGELRQIWSCFGLTSAVALGELAENPCPLELASCKEYLERLGSDEILFDSFVSKRDLLNNLASGILYQAYDESINQYVFDLNKLHRIVDLCLDQPDSTIIRENDIPITSEVIQWRDVSPAFLHALESEKRPYRLFNGIDKGDNFSQIAAYYGNCYMIPASCKDKDKAWGFLRTLLKPDYQIRATLDGYRGYPTNADAFKTVVCSYLSEEDYEYLISTMNNAVIVNYECAQIRRLLCDGLNSYLYENYDLLSAVENIQSRINLFNSEHH